MRMDRDGKAFKEKFHVGDSIRIKHLHELNDEDVYNATSENIGKDAYLGRTLTVSYVGRLMNGLWYCLAEEDDGDFCWFESFIYQTEPLPKLKKHTLPGI